VDQNNDGIYEESWSPGTHYQLVIDADEFATGASGEQRPYTHVRAVNAGQFPPVWPLARINVVQITGVWGWPAVPFAIKQAAIQVACELFKMKDSPFGILGNSEFGVARVPRAGNPYVARLLNKYVHPKRKVGV